jgi:hypothetical protein
MGLYGFWAVSNRLLYQSSGTCSSCLRGVMVGNLFLTLSIYLLPRNNSATKGYKGTNSMARYFCQSRHRTSDVARHSGLQACFFGCSSSRYCYRCREHCEGWWQTCTYYACVSSCLVWCHRLCIWALFWVNSGSAVAALPWNWECLTCEALASQFSLKQSLQHEWTYSSVVARAQFWKRPARCMAVYLILSVLIFTHISSSLMLSSHDLLMPTQS